MDIYTDYANWKYENSDFIFKLVKSKSKTISRFTSVIAVVDYLYEKKLKDENLTSDEEIIFSVGFDYIYDNFYTIKTLLEYKYNNDYLEMEKFAKTINLLLYVNEFQSELLNTNLDISKLDDFENQINKYIDNKENVPDTFFPMFDDIINPLIKQLDIDFTPIESIYYEIALEYGIYKNNDYDVYNAVFYNQLQKNKGTTM